MRKLFTLTSLILIVSCGSKKAASQQNEQTGDKSEVVIQPYILLDNDHSIMKNKGKDVPYYQIPNLDSFVVDITGYDFILPSPEFDYIRDGINYPEMLGGSFAYINLIYNDSMEVHPHRVVEPFTLIEIEENKKFAIRGIKNEFKGTLPTDFILAFRFYIDNAAGQQEIDRFNVKVGQ